MSKKLEECAKAKSQLKVTDWISSAEGSESEGTDNQYKRVLKKAKAANQRVTLTPKHTPHRPLTKDKQISKLPHQTQNPE